MIFFIKKKQSGVALVTVLFMFALLAIILSGLVVTNESNISRATAYFELKQADLLCLSGEEIAKVLLIEDFEKYPDIDHVNEAWAKSGYVYKIDGGYFEVYITDASGKFNINNIASSAADKQKDIFAAILNIALEENELSAEISSQMVDWIDVDKINGTEEFDYLSEEISYRPPNTLIADPSEIRWLQDVDALTYKKVHDEVLGDLVALPTQNKININTITPITLAGLANISISSAENYVRTLRSEKDGFSSISQAIAVLSTEIDTSFLDVKSDYFEVHVRAKFGKHYAYLKTLLFRDRASNGEIKILSRDRSERFIFPFSEDYNEDQGSNDYEIDI